MSPFQPMLAASLFQACGSVVSPLKLWATTLSAALFMYSRGPSSLGFSGSLSLSWAAGATDQLSVLRCCLRALLPLKDDSGQGTARP